jgi:hypothetical protein
MVISGLWHNVCPSIDKKKEEKKAKFGSGDFVVLIASLPVALLFGFGLKKFWELLLWLLGLVVVVAGVVEFTKKTIACIKAYWRKAKEACE